MGAILEKIYGSNAAILEKRIESDLYNVQTKGIINVGGKKCVTGYSYGELFDWDMYFENLTLSYLGISEH